METISANGEAMQETQSAQIGDGPLPPSGTARRGRMGRTLLSLRGRLFPALGYADYSRLWQANLGSMAAYSMQSLAQGWLVILLTDSPLMLGLLGVFQAIPMLAVSPFGGVMADRFDRVRVIQSVQIGLTAVALSLAVLVALEKVVVWQLLAYSAAVGTSFAISVPSRHALVADLVPRKHVPNAVSLNNASLSTSGVLGPAIAGFLVASLGVASAYFAQAAGYAWSVITLRLITARPAQPRPAGSIFSVWRAGMAYVGRNRIVLPLLMLTSSPALFGMPLITLLPALVKHELGGGPQELGLLLGALGMGSVAGAILAIASSGYAYKSRIILISLLVYGGALAALGFTKSAAMAGAVLVLVGFCQAIYFAFNHTIIQLAVPSEYRGRILSIWMLNWGLTPLGLLPVSVVAENLGTPVAMVVGGVLSAVLVVAVFVWRGELWNLSLDSGEGGPANEAEEEGGIGTEGAPATAREAAGPESA